MLKLYVIAVVTFLFAPIFVIVLFSFNASPSLVFPMEGLSLHWYRELISSYNFQRSFLNSIKVGLGATLCTTILGTLAALALIRISRRWRGVFEFLAFAPIGLPGLFIGVALVTLFAQLGLTRNLFTVTIAHVLFTLPFFIEAMRSRITYFDRSLEEAARDLGANPFQVFAKVTIPILMPTIAGAAILTFALSFDEFIITVFVSGNETTMPLYIWSMMRRTINPTINAASVITLAFSLSILALAGLWLWYQRKRAVISRASTAGELPYQEMPNE